MRKIGPNPFTPRSGQEPKVFLGRDRELETFAKHLSATQQKRFDHFVVLGEWGTGKTTLLKEFRKIAHTQKILTSFVSVHEFEETNLLLPVVQLLTQIPRNLPIKFERLKQFGKYLQGVGITLPVIGGGIEIQERKRFSGDPQVILLEGLVELWKELKQETPALVVFLDDAQHYERVPQFLGILKNVLSDDDIVQQTGYLFIVSATEEGWSAFLKKNHPIGRYFVPILRVGAFTRENTLKIIAATLKGTGVSFSREVQESVYEYTEGHPYQMQILCSYLYENQIHGKVETEQFEASLLQTLEELGAIILDPLYSQASEQEKEVLAIIAATYRVYPFDEILKLVDSKGDAIAKGALATILARLCEKGFLMKTDRGKYRVVNKLLNEFLLRK